MAIDDDEELLQDFLVEAGEILELLNEQLVDLEQRPNDTELLNAVFRGFHTIKGGAGFLSLNPLVEVCHRAEDVFNALRNGEREVDAALMDVILPVVDVVNAQFDQIRSGDEPESATPELLEALEALLKPPEEVKKEAQKPKKKAASKTKTVKKAKSNTKAKKKTAAENKSASDEGEITEDEFEALLDQLHGKGADSDSGVSGNAEQVEEKIEESSDSNEISEDEFEAMLDKLHGKGKKATGSSPVASTESSKVTSQKDEKVDKQKQTKDAPSQGETTVRVDTKRLDDIMNMVGELVLVRNRMATLGLSSRDEEAAKVVANLDIVTADLQAAVMKTRMQPIKKVFGRFPRVVRDLARSMKKEISLEMQGEETDLDKNLVEALADPLVHLVRNAVDHGIETPDEREAAGKPRSGTVMLTAEQEGDHIVLIIQDDGKGMDAEVLRKIAVKKGLMDEEAAARLDVKECYNLIFAPGFSTKETISDVSGRGVGMDVVKTRITQLNGTVEIDSELGRGSIIRIQVPLTLAIMPTLMVTVGEQIFALPLGSVNEIFHLDLTKTNIVDGQVVIMVRERALPLFYLRQWLLAGGGNNTEMPDEGHVVVVSIGAQRVGFVVDTLLGQEEVVIKPLGAMLHGMKGMAGATITGDGRISLILDVPGLMQTYVRKKA